MFLYDGRCRTHEGIVKERRPDKVLHTTIISVTPATPFADTVPKMRRNGTGSILMLKDQHPVSIIRIFRPYCV
jgi:CBS domain-containing protein